MLASNLVLSLLIDYFYVAFAFSFALGYFLAKPILEDISDERINVSFSETIISSVVRAILTQAFITISVYIILQISEFIDVYLFHWITFVLDIVLLGIFFIMFFALTFDGIFENKAFTPFEKKSIREVHKKQIEKKSLEEKQYREVWRKQRKEAFIAEKQAKERAAKEAERQRKEKAIRDEENRKKEELRRAEEARAEAERKQLILVSNQKRGEIITSLDEMNNKTIPFLMRENEGLLEEFTTEKQRTEKTVIELHELLEVLKRKKKELLSISEKERFLWRSQE